jgi:hypothetical protein
LRGSPAAGPPHIPACRHARSRRPRPRPARHPLASGPGGGGITANHAAAAPLLADWLAGRLGAAARQCPAGRQLLAAPRAACRRPSGGPQGLQLLMPWRKVVKVERLLEAG